MAQQELKEAVITKLVGLELKSDYHNLVALAFLQDLAKCIFLSTQGPASTRASWSSTPARSSA